MINLVANCVYPGEMDVYDEARLWDGPPHPSVQSYGESRRLLLTVAECYRRQKGLASVNLIVPNMYGPFDSADPNKTHALNALALKFARAVREGSMLVEVWGTGRPVREWLFVRDMARVVRQVMEDGVGWEVPVNIAQRQGFTVSELVELVRKAVDTTVRSSTTLAMGTVRHARSWMTAGFASTFSSFAFTPIESGIRSTLDYYADTMKRDREHFLL